MQPIYPVEGSVRPDLGHVPAVDANAVALRCGFVRRRAEICILNWASYGAVAAHVRTVKTASGKAASAAAIRAVGGPLADGVERDSNDQAGDA
jgi:hypothetical protein